MCYTLGLQVYRWSFALYLLLGDIRHRLQILYCTVTRRLLHIHTFSCRHHLPQLRGPANRDLSYEGMIGKYKYRTIPKSTCQPSRYVSSLRPLVSSRVAVVFLESCTKSQ